MYRILSITGDLEVKGLEMQQTGGTPLLKLPNFDVVIGDFDVFNNKATLKSIKSDGLDLHVNRGTRRQAQSHNSRRFWRGTKGR